MFIIDMNTDEIITKSEHKEPAYPDEVLDSEWNPVLPRIQPAHDNQKSSIKPAHEQIINYDPTSMDNIIEQF